MSKLFAQKQSLLDPGAEIRQKQWKDLIQRDLFDKYSQRVNACFKYLDSAGVGYVGVQHFQNKNNNFVFNYLGLNVDVNKKFAM
jgi:hypothetical protein